MSPDNPHFREEKVTMLPCKEFCFDPEKMAFLIGENKERIVPLSEIEDFYYINNLTYGMEKETKPDNKGMLLMSSIGYLIQMPPLRKWLINLDTAQAKAVKEEVADVMRAVYKLVDPHVKLPKTKGYQGFIGFSCNFDPHGIFLLQTFGNAACLGQNPSPYSLAIGTRSERSQEDLSLPVEHWFGNADTRAQRLSLYAGAGTLAYLAKESEK